MQYIEDEKIVPRYYVKKIPSESLDLILVKNLVGLPTFNELRSSYFFGYSDKFLNGWKGLLSLIVAIQPTLFLSPYTLHVQAAKSFHSKLKRIDPGFVDCIFSTIRLYQGSESSKVVIDMTTLTPFFDDQMFNTAVTRQKGVLPLIFLSRDVQSVYNKFPVRYADGGLWYHFVTSMVHLLSVFWRIYFETPQFTFEMLYVALKISIPSRSFIFRTAVLSVPFFEVEFRRYFYMAYLVGIPFYSKMTYNNKIYSNCCKDQLIFSFPFLVFQRAYKLQNNFSTYYFFEYLFFGGNSHFIDSSLENYIRMNCPDFLWPNLMDDNYKILSDGSDSEEFSSSDDDELDDRPSFIPSDYHYEEIEN